MKSFKEQLEDAKLSAFGRKKGFLNFFRWHWGSFRWWLAWKTTEWPIVGDYSINYIWNNSSETDEENT